MQSMVLLWHFCLSVCPSLLSLTSAGIVGFVAMDGHIVKLV